MTNNFFPRNNNIIVFTGFSRGYLNLLNEGSREFYGELFIWEELVCTKTLIKRAQIFNVGAYAKYQKKNYLRPLQQTFLDKMYNAGGHSHIATEKAAMQNPGY
jgi:hypothetical protein